LTIGRFIGDCRLGHLRIRDWGIEALRNRGVAASGIGDWRMGGAMPAVTTGVGGGSLRLAPQTIAPEIRPSAYGHVFELPKK
jgi:hypothetical protein